MSITTRHESKIVNRLFYGILLITAAFLLWKANYGVVFNDEPFMVSLGHRFLKGDIPFSSEWHKCQLSGLIFIPFIWLHTVIFKSTEGLLLFIRYCFVLWWLLTGLILFYRTRKYGKICLAAIVGFYLYIPLDTMTFTYNAVALSCLLLFFSYFLGKGNRLSDYINGILLALAIIAYPLLIVLAFIYGAAVIVFQIIRKKKPDILKYSVLTGRLFDYKTLIRIVISCVVIASLLIVYFIAFSSFNLFSIGFNEILTTENNATRSILLFAKNLMSDFPFIFTVGLVTIIVSLFDRNRAKRKNLYFIIQSVVLILSVSFWMVVNFLYLNIIMAPSAFLGLQAFVLNKNKDTDLFVCLWIPGVIFAVISYLSSDTGNMAIANGLSISTFAGFFFIGTYYRENKKNAGNQLQKSVCVMFSLVLAVQLGSELATRIFRNYRDQFLHQLTYKIPSGAEKGIITTKETCDAYTALHEDSQYIKTMMDDDINFLSINLSPLSYLEMDCNYATYSTWVNTTNLANYEIENEELSRYFKVHPEKTPNVIYSSLGYNHLTKEFDFIDFSRFEKHKLGSGLWLVKK